MPLWDFTDDLFVKNSGHILSPVAMDKPSPHALNPLLFFIEPLHTFFFLYSFI